MFNHEFENRFSGRYFGKYRGFVVDNQDPKFLGRVKVKVPVVLGSEEELGWALPAPNSGGRKNTGDFSLPQLNDLVWIEFEAGDVAYPVWSPGPWAFRDGESMAPEHGKGNVDATDSAVRDMSNVPPSQFEGSYGYNRTIQGPDGSFLEFDATPGSERVQLSHYSGSRLEMLSDGGMQEVGIADVRKFCVGSRNIHAGSETSRIQGDRESRVEGITTETFLGNVERTYNSLSETGGTFLTQWNGDYTVKNAGVYKVNGSGNGALSFAGQLALFTGSNMQLTCLENLEVVASAATTGYVPPADPLSGGPFPAVNIHGYNGQSIFKATDATGIGVEASLTHDPVLPTPTSVWATSIAGAPGGMIELSGLPPLPSGPANVKLGYGVAHQPVILGQSFITWLTTVLGILTAHEHPVSVSPKAPSGFAAGPSVDMGAVAATFIPQLSVPGNILSGIVSTV